MNTEFWMMVALWREGSKKRCWCRDHMVRMWADAKSLLLCVFVVLWGFLEVLCTCSLKTIK